VGKDHLIVRATDLQKRGKRCHAPADADLTLDDEMRHLPVRVDELEYLPRILRARRPHAEEFVGRVIENQVEPSGDIRHVLDDGKLIARIGHADHGALTGQRTGLDLHERPRVNLHPSYSDKSTGAARVHRNA
jgi:hypothetical protein